MAEADWMERLFGEMDGFIKDSTFVHIQAACQAQHNSLTAKHTGKVIVLMDAMGQSGAVR